MIFLGFHSSGSSTLYLDSGVALGSMSRKGKPIPGISVFSGEKEPLALLG